MANTAAAGSPDTIICSACWTAMPANSHFCSACGAQVSTTVTGPQRLAALLSEANLFRMRARWVDAENRCIEAIRIEPNSIDAHSLLGDIYRDQGKLEDAAQWYHLALDLDPHSAGDRAKLEEVEKAQSRKASSPAGAIKPGSAPSPSTHYGTQKLMGLPPATWLQAITGAAVVFVIIVIGIAISIRGGKTAAETSGLKQAEVLPPPGSPLPASGAPEQSQPLSAIPRPSGPSPAPVVPSVPRSIGASMPSSENPPAEEKTEVISENEPEGTAARPVRSVSSGATDYERNLRRFVIEKARLGRDVAIGAVMVDPRYPRAAVVVSLAPRRADQSVIRAVALRSATRVAVAGLAADAVLNTVTVNVRLRTGADRFVPVFAGDADRNAAQSLGDDPTLDQMIMVYSSHWWAPGFAPPRGPQSEASPAPAP